MAESFKINELLSFINTKKATKYRDRLVEIKEGIKTYATEDNINEIVTLAKAMHYYTTNPNAIRTRHDNDTFIAVRKAFKDGMAKFTDAQYEACAIYAKFLNLSAVTDTVLITQMHNLNQEIAKKHIDYHARILGAETGATEKKQNENENKTTPETQQSTPKTNGKSK